jgi:LmbE family N-acetylglucosaminyl deacetylase
MAASVLVAAHPDDAELAVGGTIAALTDLGIEVVVAFATVSELDPERRGRRVAAAERAAKILGHRISWLFEGRYDQAEDIPEYALVREVDALTDAVRPETVLTHCEQDSHGDHVRVARAVMSSTRRLPATTLLEFGPNDFRTARHREFAPDTFLPITADQLARKVEAITAYDYEGRGYRKLETDAVELMAQANGIAVGAAYAEALRLRRQRLDTARLAGLCTLHQQHGHGQKV